MSPETYQAAPVESRDPERDGWVHWATPGSGSDPFMDGARWMMDHVYTRFFGPLIGPLLLEVNGYQRWDPSSSSWQDMA